MAFVPKDWRDLPDHSTPITAAALEDMETRVTDYADTLPLGSTYNNTFNIGDITVEAGALGGIYPVTDSGAVGDGSADDTTAVQTAIGLAKTNGGMVYFPPGVYKITSELDCTGPPTKAFALRGAGPGNHAGGGNKGRVSVLRYTPDTGSLLNCNSCAGLEVSHLFLEYESSSYTGDLISVDGGPLASDCLDFHFHHLGTRNVNDNSAQSIINFHKAICGQVDHCHFTGADYCIRFDPTNYCVSITVADCIFNTSNTAHIGLLSPDGENLVIERCVFEAGTNTPGIAGDLGSTGLYSPIIRDCWFGDAGADTTWIVDLNTQTWAPGVIQGNRMYEVGGAGRYMEQLKGPWVILGNSFQGAGGGTDSVFGDASLATLTLVGNQSGNVNSWWTTAPSDYSSMDNGGLSNRLAGSLGVGLANDLTLGRSAGYTDPGVDGVAVYYESNDRSLILQCPTNDGREVQVVTGATPAARLRIGNGGGIGFYGTAPQAKPTGVAVSAAGIHAALVTLGLISA